LISDVFSSHLIYKKIYVKLTSHGGGRHVVGVEAFRGEGELDVLAADVGPGGRVQAQHETTKKTQRKPSLHFSDNCLFLFF